MDQNPIFVPGKIFVQGLSPATGYRELRNYFSKYGTVVYCNIREDRIPGRNLGYGFVTFSDPSVVDTVIKDKHVIDGHQIGVRRYRVKNNEDDKFKTNRLYVCGNPGLVSRDNLARFFSHYGQVISCSIETETGDGCIYFASTQQVDDFLNRSGNLIDFYGDTLEVSKHLLYKGRLLPSRVRNSLNAARARNAGDFGAHDHRRMPVYNPAAAGRNMWNGLRDANGRVVQNQLCQPYGSYGNIRGSGSAMVPLVQFSNNKSIGYRQYYNAPIDAGQGGLMRHDIATYADHHRRQNVGPASVSQGASGGALNAGQVDTPFSLFSYPMVSREKYGL